MVRLCSRLVPHTSRSPQVDHRSDGVVGHMGCNRRCTGAGGQSAQSMDLYMPCLDWIALRKSGDKNLKSGKEMGSRLQG